MRTLTVLLLTSMIGSCPILCGSVGEVLGLHAHEEHGSHGKNPGSTPTNDDDCVCNGAILSAQANHGFSAVGVDAGAPYLPIGHWLTPNDLFAAPTLALDGRPDDPPEGPTRADRSLLQNFRC